MAALDFETTASPPFDREIDEPVRIVAAVLSADSAHVRRQ
jgi:hypothetical protein